MWRKLTNPDVSKELGEFIFNGWEDMLLGLSQPLMLKALISFEKSVSINQATQRHVPADHDLCITAVVTSNLVTSYWFHVTATWPSCYSTSSSSPLPLFLTPYFTLTQTIVTRTSINDSSIRERFCRRSGSSSSVSAVTPSSSGSAHSYDLEHCPIKLQLVISSDKSQTKSNTPMSSSHRRWSCRLRH